MRQDLEKGYIAGCADCQRNKSPTTKPRGPLHPLPVPDRRCDSVAIDFIGPLPSDDGYDTIIKITDRLGSDIRLIPFHSTATAEQLALAFLEHWYCENGLPLEIVSDRDKLFLSQFWTHLHTLTGVSLKMSSAYHPQTDGASGRTNKMLIQCIRFVVERDQKGWARALPKIRFNLMNTRNASMGYTPFQLRFGKSPRLLPPLVPDSTSANQPDLRAAQLIDSLRLLEFDAQDNLHAAKITQAYHVNAHISYVSRTPTLYAFHNHPHLGKLGVVVFVDEQHWSFLVDIPQGNHGDFFPTLGVRCNVETDASSALFPRLPLEGDIVFFQGFIHVAYVPCTLTQNITPFHTAL